MNTDSRRAFVISLILHAGFFGILAVAMLVDWLRPRPIQDHVFTLVSPAEAAEPVDSPRPEPTPSPPEAEPELAIPEIDPVRPAPEPQAAAPPPPVPTPEPPRRLSREEFVREFGQPRETAPRPRPRPTITAPTIDVSQVREELQQINRRSGASAQVSEDELIRWRNGVYRLLNSAWEEPREISGRDLSAVVQFDVAPDGTIRGIRFVRSSGNEIFDRSISRALEQVRRVDPPPGGRGFSPTMTFQKIGE